MIAICSTVKDPQNFDFWLNHHLDLGVDYFFIRIEDTASLKSITDNYSQVFPLWIDSCNYWDIYFTLQTRQLDFIDSIQSNLKDLGVKWLIHIDSDELICCNQLLPDLLDTVEPEYQSVHFNNFEAVFARDDLANPFHETTEFLYSNFLTYCNGKSASRVNQFTKALGPHLFDGQVYKFTPSEIVILHYESATFDIWYNKFLNLSKIAEDKMEKIPFPFYRQSIKFISEGDVEKSRSFWKSNKLSPKDKTIKLFWTPHSKVKNFKWSYDVKTLYDLVKNFPKDKIFNQELFNRL